MYFGKKKKKSQKRVQTLKRQLKREIRNCRPPCVNMSDWNREFQTRMGWVGPFTQDVFVDPVVANDGYTYERSALERCLEGRLCRGVGGESLSTFSPNINLKNMLREVYSDSSEYRDRLRDVQEAQSAPDLFGAPQLVAEPSEPLTYSFYHDAPVDFPPPSRQEIQYEIDVLGDTGYDSEGDSEGDTEDERMVEERRQRNAEQGRRDLEEYRRQRNVSRAWEEFGKKYKRKSSSLKKQAKRLKIRLTVTRNGKRFPKSNKVLRKQIKEKLKSF